MPHVRRSPGLSLNSLEDRTTPTAGTMDPSFGGGDGIARFNLPGHYEIDARGVAVQPDGKTVLAGEANAPGAQKAAVFRLTADGSLDPAFGENGVATVATPNTIAYFYDVEVRPDGKIVASGTTAVAGNYMVLVARFNPDGTPDTTFSGDGYVTTDLTPRDENGFSLAVQPDGKVVVCGNILSDNDNGFLFLRYTADGILDPTFSLDGVLKYNPGPVGGIGRSVSVQPDGKIVGAGAGSPSGQPEGLMLIRLNPDGTFDTSFNADGVVHTLIPGTGYAEGYDAAVLPDGRLVAVGVGEVNSMGQAVAARYLTDGSLDTTFNGDGTFLLTFPPDAAGGGLTTVTADAAGRIVAAGFSAFPHNALLTRFEEDGTPDPDFGVGNFLIRSGVVTTEAGGGEEIYDLAVLPDGRMVIAGKSDSNLVAVRYLGDPTALADQYTATEDTPLDVAAPGVLANDVLPAGNPQATLVQGPAHAADFTLNADGSFSYLPVANSNGPDSFTYKLVDGGLTSNTVTVALTVQAVNDVPTSAADAHEYRFFSPLTVSAADGVLKNDADADGDPLTAVLVDPPAQGTVNLNADGSFTFTYPEGLTDTVTFTYKATDGTADGPVTAVTLTPAANAPPVSGADAFALPVFSSLTVSKANGVLKNDTDADGDPLTAVLVTPPAVGNLTLRPDGSFTYGFPPTFVGSVTFTYAATDGTDQGAPATVTLTQASRVEVNGGNVYVFGTDGPDAVRVRPAGGQTVRVTLQTPAGLTSQVVSLPPKPGYQFVVALGPGDDRLDVDAGSRRVRAFGGAGDDVIWTGRGADLLFGDDEFPGATGNDAIDAGGGFNQVAPGDGDDVVRTGAGPDIVVAGAGRKQIATGGGNDTVKAGAGGSFIDAGVGNDEVTVAGGSNWIEGGSGSDVLLGGTGADRIFGGAGQDMVSGGKGADLVDGGLGNDILFEGTVETWSPTGPTLATLLSRYRSTKRAALNAIGEKLFVVVDLASADTLTGGAGTDWFWSPGVPDILDRTAAEPRN